MSCLNINIFVLKSRYTYNFRTIFLTVRQFSSGQLKDSHGSLSTCIWCCMITQLTCTKSLSTDKQWELKMVKRWLDSTFDLQQSKECVVFGPTGCFLNGYTRTDKNGGDTSLGTYSLSCYCYSQGE